MTTKTLRGDAVAVAQVTRCTPATIQVDDVFALAVNGKTIAEFTATDTSASTVVAALVTAWNASTVPEATEITASEDSGVLVLTADTAGVPFEVTLAATDGGGADTQSFTSVESVRSEGPEHADSPRNWSGNRCPDSGDDVVVSRSLAGLLYGLVWRVTATFDAGTNTWTMDELADFVEDQILRLTNDGGALPAGYAVDTDYYVVNLDRDARTFQLSATSGGSAVNGTDAGTGTHTVAVELGSLRIRSEFSRTTNLCGLPQLRNDNYVEYRQRAWKFGLVRTPTPTIEIGDRGRGGSRRIVLDVRGYAFEFTLLSSGAGIDDLPAVLLLADHADANVTVLDGELGIAVLPGETSTIGSYVQRDGEVRLRDVTIGSGIEKTGGVLEGEGITLSGTLTL